MSGRRAAIAVLASMLAAALLLAPAGCGGPPESSSYFALEEGNSWLYRGKADGAEYTLEVTVTAPDASLGLRDGITDVAVTGTLGSFKVSEQGLYLESGPDEVKLWGVRTGDGPPRFFDAPYVWLERPLAVGREYNTAVEGAPTPAVMTVTGTVEEPTPWGARDAFILEERGGSGPAGGVKLAFVPFLGFTRIDLGGYPGFVLEAADLR